MAKKEDKSIEELNELATFARKTVQLEAKKKESFLSKRKEDLLVALRVTGSKRPILDRVLQLFGIIGISILVLWIVSLVVLPGSVFGLIGKAQRPYVNMYGKMIIQNISANESYWSVLTARGVTANLPVYDIFGMNDPDAIRIFGTIFDTAIVLTIFVGIASLVAIYIRDFVIIAKTLAVLAKDSTKSGIQEVKANLEEINKLYSDDTKPKEKPVKEEKTEPAKKGKPIIKKKVAQKQEIKKEEKEEVVEVKDTSKLDATELTDEQLDLLLSGDAKLSDLKK